SVGQTFAVGQVHLGRITRVADFGAFVELRPGVEALAHVSTFPPTGTQDGWKATIPPGTRGTFEILSLDPVERRIGVAMIDAGTARAEAAQAAVPTEDGGADQAPPSPTRGRIEIVPGARLKGKVDRHEKFGVFVFLAPGKTGLLP